MRTFRGYTIVEMLVVCAIIMVLMMIVGPSIARAREAARRAVCGSNLRQAHLAHTNWAGDRFGAYVEGQPAYDKFRDEGKKSNFGNMGQYAVWNREWKKPSRADEYGGKYAKHGALVTKGYLPDGRTFYCPSWAVPWIQYQTSGEAWDTPGGGWFEDPADVPDKKKYTQQWMQTSYHYNSQFGSSDYTSMPDARGARSQADSPTAALAADAFSDPSRGVDMHHIDGYMVLYLGGHASFYNDPARTIRDQAGGRAYHSNNSTAGAYEVFQARAWRLFEGRP